LQGILEMGQKRSDFGLGEDKRCRIRFGGYGI